MQLRESGPHIFIYEGPSHLRLVEDITGWLRGFGLEKYADALKDIHWTDLVKIPQEELKKRGVVRKDERRTMKRSFNIVRCKSGGT